MSGNEKPFVRQRGPVTLRTYRDADFPACADLVNRAWDLDRRLRPVEFALLAKELYTGSSLAESNYASVVESDGDVVGFIYGRCGAGRPYRNPYATPWGRARVMARFLALRDLRLLAKLRWIRAMAQHQWNRSRTGVTMDNEITLFVVEREAQGKGYGRLLLADFLDRCRARGARRVVVETDRDSNYGFYEHLGFTVVGEFTSPLNELVAGTVRRSYLYELTL